MTKIFGHRGASGYAPENTMEAFQLALDQGVDGVELDVHLTRDGHLLVAHDEKIDRVSDGSGLIAEMRLDQIQKFTFNATHPQYEGARAPTLNEVLDLFRPTGKEVNIELKNSVLRYTGMEKKVIDLVRDLKMEDRVIFSSFNHHSMLTVKAIDPKLRCGLLYECCLVRPWDYAKKLGMEAMHPHFAEPLLVEEEVDEAHKLGLDVNVWTVNDERILKRLIDVGVDIAITNYPDRMIALRDQL